MDWERRHSSHLVSADEQKARRPVAECVTRYLVDEPLSALGVAKDRRVLVRLRETVLSFYISVAGLMT